MKRIFIIMIPGKWKRSTGKRWRLHRILSNVLIQTFKAHGVSKVYWESVDTDDKNEVVSTILNLITKLKFL